MLKPAPQPTRIPAQKRELYATIASLEKDIASLKREIRERDETIGDKVRRGSCGGIMHASIIWRNHACINHLAAVC